MTPVLSLPSFTGNRNNIDIFLYNWRALLFSGLSWHYIEYQCGRQRSPTWYKQTHTIIESKMGTRYDCIRGELKLWPHSCTKRVMPCGRRPLFPVAAGNGHALVSVVTSAFSWTRCIDVCVGGRGAPKLQERTSKEWTMKDWLLTDGRTDCNLTHNFSEV